MFNTSVISLGKQQMLEMAGDLLLLASGKLDDKAIVLRTTTDQVIFCSEEDYRYICNQLEQSTEADKDGLTEVMQEAYLAEEDTEVHP